MNSTTSLIGFAATALAGYFAIMNPISNTATFIGITTGDDRATKKAIATQSLLLAFAIIAVVSVTGNLIFKVFGITLGSIRVTGGIVVFLIGYNMLMGSGNTAHTPNKEDVANSREAQLSVAVSPLAVPMLAGPGTIATAMSFAAGGWLHIAVSLAAFAVICLVTYLCFIESDKLVAHLGQNGLNVMTRLMGLIVASIGVGMFLTGIGYTPGNQVNNLDDRERILSGPAGLVERLELNRLRESPPVSLFDGLHKYPRLSVTPGSVTTWSFPTRGYQRPHCRSWKSMLRR